VPVRADLARLDTIVSNLLDNAIKYSPRGGEIGCEVSRKKGFAYVTVTDSGLGIAHEDMGILFTRFGRIVTAENSSIAGTGLGLYLSRELARMHGGDITATSEPAAGSSFSLVLPLDLYQS
jgi:signal transduction histidine kinase